ncbi:MAG: phosphate ABC transporter ATP-binding protein [Bacteroidota bacterium]|nr:phosphate ABC transporter ATP-binding protein [Bacteroidota bacterium]MDP4217453.1 phosphate ABC transporter ATP-binding protein [Bacteroidota bacterium]MDP4246391.1 phosphate ABC transporter ATP-binding protein [Bacteroidota bacterium]MDP4255414.1 phosphate ABC transporter ATP-binding protein [Bacteroidota bacterium]MDP4259249.1 phosphate ABC transporter ATP-binding protein [Bacteroidota bacterium]
MTFEAPHIRVQDLNVHIGDHHILKNISLDIPDKKITSFIGPSGCGKTTLLKTFNRLLDRNKEVRIGGRVLVDGEDIYGKDVEVTGMRRKMGLLSQRPFPLPMSIYDNIAYGPRIHGTRRKKELNGTVEHYLRATGLWEEVKDRLGSPATRLSIGQQQRLCLARGLAVEPEIILGDEPTSALDPLSTQRIEELFLQLKDRYTIVLVTHILRQARRLSDYIVFIYMGEIIEFGPTEEVLLDPKERLTREYVKGYIS